MEVIHPILGNFKIIKEIGSGTYAKVYLAQHSQLSYKVAIKIFFDTFSEEAVKRSFCIFKNVCHPFLCQVYDFFEFKNHRCILMEYVEGTTLLEYVNNYGPMNEHEIKKIIGQLLIAIEFLHKNGIIHRDIKCENILIDPFHNIRLIDFDFTCDDSCLHSTTCGSPAYIAPEVISHDNYDKEVDIWSLGIITYALCFGMLPFEDPSLKILLELILKTEPDYPLTASASLIDLIKQMLMKDPQQRISIGDMKKHAFFSVDDLGRNYEFNSEVYTIVAGDDTQSPYEDAVNFMKLSSEDTQKLIQDLKENKMNQLTLTYKIIKKIKMSNHLAGFGKCFLNIQQKKNTWSNSDTFNGIISGMVSPLTNTNIQKCQLNSPQKDFKTLSFNRAGTGKKTNQQIVFFPKVILTSSKNVLRMRTQNQKYLTIRSASHPPIL